MASVGAGASPGDQFRIINNEGSDPVVLDSTTPGFMDPLTGDLISQGEIFTTANGVRLSMDYQGGTGNDVVLTYVNTPAMAPELAVTPGIINEGGRVTVTGRLSDPDQQDRLTLVVDWRDGSRSQTFHPGRNPFTLHHRYRDDGDYRPLFTWFDEHGAGNSRELAVTVNNVAPRVLGTLPPLLPSAGHFTTFVSFGVIRDPGADTWTGSVDYGDGTGMQPLLMGGNRFLLLHRYQQPGTYTLNISVLDDDGGVSTTAFTVRVRPAGSFASLVERFFALTEKYQGRQFFLM